MPIINLEEVYRDAHAKLQEEAHKAEVEKHVKKLRARKAHMFSKRVKLQWPVRFEDWYNPTKR